MDKNPETQQVETEAASPSYFSSLVDGIIYSPVNLILTLVIAFLIYRIYKTRSMGEVTVSKPEPALPRLRKDMTAAQLRQYDGTQPEGRVLVAVNGWIFDVTKGKRFYGPGGPYAAFGGRDASRGLATFSVTATDKEYDDLSDLNSMEMESVREWEAQFREKYELVGKLLKPDEEPTNYSDEETEDTDNSSATPLEAKKNE